MTAVTHWGPAARLRAAAAPLLGPSLALAALLALAYAANWAIHGVAEVDTPLKAFPISVFAFEPKLLSLIAAPLHVAFFLTLSRRGEPLGFAAIWLAAVLALVLGNLLQGGLWAGFLAPMLADGNQYWSDAARVTDGWPWLAEFNRIQPDLLTHGRTHPPFAVLVHMWLGSPQAVAAVFTALSALLPPLAMLVARELGAGPVKASQAGLMAAAVPAFGIYGAVSLDGLIAVAATLGLWGGVRLAKGWSLQGFAALAGGALAMFALTFGGLFLVAALGLLALRQPRLLAAGLAAAAVLAAAGLGLKALTGFDYVQAFLTASALENPGGFHLLRHPLDYAATRLENLAEILLFLSIPLGGWLLLRGWRVAQPPAVRVAASGVAALALMFLAGAFRTGETARACLFILPYLLVLVPALPAGAMRLALLLAAAQTAMMQSLGNYFW